MDLAAVTALGVLSTAIAGAVQVQLRSGWREQANLYLVGIARSGEGKSPMMRKFVEPLHQIERDRQEAARPNKLTPRLSTISSTSVGRRPSLPATTPRR